LVVHEELVLDVLLVMLRVCLFLGFVSVLLFALLLALLTAGVLLKLLNPRRHGHVLRELGAVLALDVQHPVDLALVLLRVLPKVSRPSDQQVQPQGHVVPILVGVTPDSLHEFGDQSIFGPLVLDFGVNDVEHLHVLLEVDVGVGLGL